MNKLLPLLLASSLMGQHHEPLAGPHGGAPRLNPPARTWAPRSVHPSRREIEVIPYGHRETRHQGHRYFFSRGLWYRPFGNRYILCYPPVGMWVSILPAFAQTVVIASVTYIVIEEVYYVRSGMGYEVVAPPVEKIQ